MIDIIYSITHPEKIAMITSNRTTDLIFGHHRYEIILCIPLPTGFHTALHLLFMFYKYLQTFSFSLVCSILLCDYILVCLYISDHSSSSQI